MGGPMRALSVGAIMGSGEKGSLSIMQFYLNSSLSNGEARKEVVLRHWQRHLFLDTQRSAQLSHLYRFIVDLVKSRGWRFAAISCGRDG